MDSGSDAVDGFPVIQALENEFQAPPPLPQLPTIPLKPRNQVLKIKSHKILTMKQSLWMVLAIPAPPLINTIQRAIQRIRSAQNTTDLVLSEVSVQRIVRETVPKMLPHLAIRMQVSTLTIFHECMEIFILELLSKSGFASTHAARTTLNSRNMVDSVRLSNARLGPLVVWACVGS